MADAPPREEPKEPTQDEQAKFAQEVSVFIAELDAQKRRLVAESRSGKKRWEFSCTLPSPKESEKSDFSPPETKMGTYWTLLTETKTGTQSPIYFRAGETICLPQKKNLMAKLVGFLQSKRAQKGKHYAVLYRELTDVLFAKLTNV